MVCVDPLEACETALREKPDLILLDLVMPQMGGFEALLWLKERPQTKTIPVLVCSVNMDRKTALEVAALGAAGVLTKPVNKQDLLDSLRRALPANLAA